MSALTWIAVTLLGGAGAVLRVVVTDAVAARDRLATPAGTLVVNLTGAFALGLLSGADVDGDARLLAGTALLGSYTTFSTWMLEADRLGLRRTGAAYVALTLALGLAAAALGRALA